MKKKEYFKLFFIILTIVLPTNCSQDTNSSKVTVNLDLGLNNTKSKTVTKAPSDITALTVTVSSGNETLFTSTYSDSTEFDRISFSLEKNSRVTIYISANGTSMNYFGISTTDLKPGVNNITITMNGTFTIASYPSIDGWDEPKVIAVDDTAIYIGGYYANSSTGTNDWRLEKRSIVDGSLITTFNSTGYINWNLSSQNSENSITGITIDGDYLYISGIEEIDYSGDYQCYQGRIEKRNKTTGTLDASFGTGGVINSEIYPYFGSEYRKLNSLTSDSSYLYIGYSEHDGNTEYYSRIEKRLKSDGSLEDTLFNNSTGYLNFNNYSGSPDESLISSINDVIVDNSYIYSAGYLLGSTTERKIDRVSIDTGTLDSDWLTPTTYTFINEYLAMAKQNSTAIFTGGYYTDSDTYRKQWLLEKWNLTTDTLDTSFGDNGSIVSSYADYSENWISSIVTDTNNVYIAGQTDLNGDGDYQWQVEKRDINTGELVSGFGSDGIFYLNLSTSDDSIKDIAIDENCLYLIGTDSSPSSGSQWRIIKISKYTGKY